MEYEDLQENLKKNQNTWLITGVAGFIGSNLLEALLILNQKVVGLDNFETGFQHNIDQAIEDAEIATQKTLRNNFKFITGDITNIEDCHLACFGVDYVLHHAAIGSVPRSIENPIMSNKSNIDGFLNMLVASRDAKIKRFVYASSSANYGDHSSLPKIEDHIGNPLSPYAVTKVTDELYSNVFASTFGLKSIGLRYFNIFGKRQDPNGAYAAVIPCWISSILNQESVFINGDGSSSRDFCYINNVIQVNILAAKVNDDEAINQIYNVAVGENTSLNDLFQIIEDLLVNRSDLLIKKKPIYREFRDGDVKHSLADISKAKTLLGFNASYSLEQGLDELMDWYLSKNIYHGFKKTFVK